MMNKYRKTPLMRVEIAIVPLRPRNFMSTVYAAIMLPGTAAMEVMKKLR